MLPGIKQYADRGLTFQAAAACSLRCKYSCAADKRSRKYWEEYDKLAGTKSFDWDGKVLLAAVA